MRFAYTAALLALLGTAQPATGQKYVQVTGQKVNIREGPGGAVFSQAQAGDLFKFGKRQGEWFAIFMFAGEYRYIHASLARRTDVVPPLPNEATRRQAFQALVRAEDRALTEADRRIPPNNMDAINKNIDLNRLLNDKYKLVEFHRYGMVAVQYDTLRVEGIRRKWMP